MPKPLVPKLSGDEGMERLTQRWPTGDEGIELAVAVTSQNHHPSVEVLNRETESVKFNSDKVVTSKRTNRDQIFDKTRSNGNIT
jgi:hypothetical protein